MKRCPKCNRIFTNDSQKFCTHDGGLLVASEPAQGETIHFDSAALDDAPTKAISRELVSEITGPFDPMKTTVGQNQPDQERTSEVRGRITSDLAPQSAPLPPEQPTAAPLTPPSSELISQPPLQTPAQPTQPQQVSAPSGSGPISPSAPMPPPQFAPASQAQQVQPLGAPQPKKKSKLPLILGVGAVLFIFGIAAAAAAYVFLPRLIARRTVERPIQLPKPTIEEPTPIIKVTPSEIESPAPTPDNEPPPYSPPSDAVQFVNSNANLDGKLAEHYVDFNFYYPERWKKDPKAGVPGASNFVKVERRLPPDFTQENFAVGWYSSSGSEAGDRATFPTLVENLSAQFAKNFPDYRKISEGKTKAGPYDGYEFRFESRSRNTAKGDLKVWGRVILIPPVDGGKNGVTLLMLTTSLAPELKSVDDVGDKGELPMVLESFRFGKKN
ncbi:MAG TPA: hypothetical protein VHD88_08355 [Pyrinomonadaceae bacterium]|nr:hypothetical protein [Pyrinomonadaceae bacterium]